MSITANAAAHDEQLWQEWCDGRPSRGKGRHSIPEGIGPYAVTGYILTWEILQRDHALRVPCPFRFPYSSCNVPAGEMCRHTRPGRLHMSRYAAADAELGRQRRPRPHRHRREEQ
jgi:hypothetical protein